LFVTSREDRFLQGFELEVDSASSTAEMVVLSGAGHASDLLTMYPELPERVADWLAARLR
jgi:hypothetical protein